MSDLPQNSKAGAKTANAKAASKTAARRKSVKIVAFDEAKRKSRSKKEFNIARGAVHEGALYDPSEPLSNDADGEKSRIASMVEAKKQARKERQRLRTKAKADKKFDKAYGDGSSAAGTTGGRISIKNSSSGKGRLLGHGRRRSDAGAGSAGSAGSGNAAGPRAAVYKGKMGSSHKKSTRMQTSGTPSATSNASGISLPSFRLPDFSRKISITLAVVLVTAFCAFSLYGPAQQYYTQMRETDRLQAEYAAVAARSDALQSEINSLQTPSGIEDKAHADLGYVKANEQTATVKGITFEDTSEFTSNVVPGSIPAPDTWYSPFLDAFFKYGK